MTTRYKCLKDLEGKQVAYSDYVYIGTNVFIVGRENFEVLEGRHMNFLLEDLGLDNKYFYTSVYGYTSSGNFRREDYDAVTKLFNALYRIYEEELNKEEVELLKKYSIQSLTKIVRKKRELEKINEDKKLAQVNLDKATAEFKKIIELERKYITGTEYA